MSAHSFPTDQTDDPMLFKKLMQKPHIAWPTIMLLCAALVLFAVSTIAYLQNRLPLFWAMFLNCIASYMAFPVAHDATHSAVSANRRLNDWAGRIAMMLLEPGPFLTVFRFIHMRHHRFTNEPDKDPDMYCGMGSKWLLPFRWLTLDFVYFRIYLSHAVFKKRPMSERREFYFALLFVLAVIIFAVVGGWFTLYLLLFFIPTRVAKYLIIIAFDFLPHYPHETHGKDDPFKSTSNRVGMEWLLTPLLVYQNYHLVHHLYPAIPFYRYLRVWNAKKQYHLSQSPALTDTFSLRPRESKP